MIEIGDTLAGRYEIRGDIETLTLAQIKEAYDLTLDRAVAIKIMANSSVTQFYGSEDMVRMEAKTIAGMEHPNILPAYDFGQHEDFFYLVTRYYNETLHAYLAKRTANEKLPDLKVMIDVLRSIATAIDHVHDRGIVHRNIKTAGIVLDTQVKNKIYPYISDFGVAVLELNHVGTPLYMAPEQFTYEYPVTTAIDIYAYGVLMYECLTGTVPKFQGIQPLWTGLVLERGPALMPIKTYNPSLPASVDLVVTRLTRLDPAERYSTALEAADDLAKAFYSRQKQITGKVFISYARADQEYVYSLAKELRQAGVDLWIDRDIPPGANWDEQIENAMEVSTAMLIIASPASMESNNVQDEWSYFLEEGKDVYPFIYQECKIPFRLRRLQYVKSTGDLMSDLAKIVDLLAGDVPSSL